ncbi:MAG: hypothetical protein ACXWJM_00780 [Ramlibacter sp.]
MNPDKSTGATGAAAPAEAPSWRERLHIGKSSVPAAAVVTVAIVSVATAVMMSRQQGAQHDVRPPPGIADSQRVVKAPPLVVKAPPLNAPQKLAQAGGQHDGALATHSAGAGPDCRNCGVVESVASNRPSTYQMRVRMDDGTVKSIEQRAAFPAGSRVVVEGGTLRAATENG